MVVSSQRTLTTYASGPFLFLVSLVILAVTSTTNAFITSSLSPNYCFSLSLSTSTSTSATDISYTLQVVDGGEDDPRVIDVATFRNQLVNPQMMVSRAEKKRDSIDNNKAALDGVKIGLLFIGPVIAVGTYFTTPATSGDTSTAITDAFKNYGLFGGGLGVILGGNNYMGRSVHVPDVPEATNRIVVDLSEGLLRKQDMGFIAISTSDDDKDQRFFAPSNGILASVDAQLRNSPDSPNGVRTIDNYPSHLHVKNMDVHYKKRRQGIGKALLQLIFDHAKSNTDAQLLTLEVEAVNQPAVQLYRKFGFETKDNPNRRSNNLFMVKDIYN